MAACKDKNHINWANSLQEKTDVLSVSVQQIHSNHPEPESSSTEQIEEHDSEHNDACLDLFSQIELFLFAERFIDADEVNLELKSLRTIASKQSSTGGHGVFRCDCKTTFSFFWGFGTVDSNVFKSRIILS